MSLLIWATGCQAPKAPAPPPAPHDGKCDLRETRVLLTCPPNDCGENSSVINAFPYNGLHADGCLNADKVGLAPYSLVRDHSRCDSGGTDPLYLDIADIAQVEPAAGASGYELVAKGKDGRIRCKGLELVGSTFAVVDQNGATRATLRISQMGATSVTRGAPPAPVPARLGNVPGFVARVARTAADATTRRAVYLITPADQPASSLCMSPPPEATPGKPTPILVNGASPSGTLSEIDPGELAGYAVILPGAVYNAMAELIAPSVAPPESQVRGSSNRWFNIACATDGLAQTELSGLAAAPVVDQASAVARLPALHMFTAKYCSGVSATMRGTPIAWRLNDAPRSMRAAGRLGPVEAKWGPHGALCVAHSRLWLANKTIALPPQLLDLPMFRSPIHPITYPMDESDFLSRLCPDRVPDCGDLDAPNALVSYTVDHID